MSEIRARVADDILRALPGLDTGPDARARALQLFMEHLTEHEGAEREPAAVPAAPPLPQPIGGRPRGGSARPSFSSAPEIERSAAPVAARRASEAGTRREAAGAGGARPAPGGGRGSGGLHSRIGGGGGEDDVSRDGGHGGAAAIGGADLPAAAARE